MQGKRKYIESGKRYVVLVGYDIVERTDSEGYAGAVERDLITAGHRNVFLAERPDGCGQTPYAINPAMERAFGLRAKSESNPIAEGRMDTGNAVANAIGYEID